jgi:uncharacterized protein DUF2442
MNNQPVATSVRYNYTLRKVIIELSSGCTLLVPPEVSPELVTASTKDLEGVKIQGPGVAIEWPKLNVELSVDGLLKGKYTTPGGKDRRQAMAVVAQFQQKAKKRGPGKAKAKKKASKK